MNLVWVCFGVARGWKVASMPPNFMELCRTQQNDRLSVLDLQKYFFARSLGKNADFRDFFLVIFQKKVFCQISWKKVAHSATFFRRDLSKKVDIWVRKQRQVFNVLIARMETNLIMRGLVQAFTSENFGFNVFFCGVASKVDLTVFFMERVK